jgi:hypothetical protein
MLFTFLLMVFVGFLWKEYFVRSFLAWSLGVVEEISMCRFFLLCIHARFHGFSPLGFITWYHDSGLLLL